MANTERKPGLIDRGLEGWQKVNKITLTVGVSGAIVGVALGMPWLVSLGLGSAALDAAQILFINKVKDKRQKPKMQAI